MRGKLSLLFAIGLVVAGWLPALAGAQDLQQPSFNYDDIDRFAEALAKIDTGTDPIEVFQEYLDGASAGLFGWTERYDNVTAERYAGALEKFPKYFRYLSQYREALESREAEISEYLVALRDLAGEALGRRTLSILPTYYFVTPLGGGGSVEPIANMIGVDYYGRNPDAPLEEFAEYGFRPEGQLSFQPIESMTIVVAHEMVHWYQVMTQGTDDYIALYREPGADTLLARAVREGGADFLAFLASGRSTADQREYGLAHEETLWQAFRAKAYELSEDNPGWFSGRNPDIPDAPYQIGYFVGLRMCEAYYESAEDKPAALRYLLSVKTPEDYEVIAAAYDRRLSAP